MNKQKIIITFLLTIIFSQFSCNKTKTYVQRLKEQSKAIDRFIQTEGIKVLKKYPVDKVFKENEFYLDPGSGVYYHVIDSGKGKPIIPGREVYIRYKGLRYFMGKDTVSYTNIYQHDPEKLVYGNNSTYSSIAFVVPLEHVRNGGSVRMIVPFDVGTSVAQTESQPVYYEKVTYRFEQ